MHRRIIRLALQGLAVQMVTSEANCENDKGQEVAAVIGAFEYARQEVIAVFYIKLKLTDASAAVWSNTHRHAPQCYTDMVSNQLSSLSPD